MSEFEVGDRVKINSDSYRFPQGATGSIQSFNGDLYFVDFDEYASALTFSEDELTKVTTEEKEEGRYTEHQIKKLADKLTEPEKLTEKDNDMQEGDTIIDKRTYAIGEILSDEGKEGYRIRWSNGHVSVSVKRQIKPFANIREQFEAGDLVKVKGEETYGLIKEINIRAANINYVADIQLASGSIRECDLRNLMLCRELPHDDE